MSWNNLKNIFAEDENFGLFRNRISEEGKLRLTRDEFHTGPQPPKMDNVGELKFWEKTIEGADNEFYLMIKGRDEIVQLELKRFVEQIEKWDLYETFSIDNTENWIIREGTPVISDGKLVVTEPIRLRSIESIEINDNPLILKIRTRNDIDNFEGNNVFYGFQIRDSSPNDVFIGILVSSGVARGYYLTDSGSPIEFESTETFSANATWWNQLRELEFKYWLDSEGVRHFEFWAESEKKIEWTSEETEELPVGDFGARIHARYGEVDYVKLGKNLDQIDLMTLNSDELIQHTKNNEIHREIDDTTTSEIKSWSSDKINTTLSGYAELSGATFTGNITANNLSGTNTGDQESSDFNLADLSDVVNTAKATGKILQVNSEGNHEYVDLPDPDLSNLVPYTGATGDVNLGNNYLTSEKYVGGINSAGTRFGGFYPSVYPGLNIYMRELNTHPWKLCQITGDLTGTYPNQKVDLRIGDGFGNSNVGKIKITPGWYGEVGQDLLLEAKTIKLGIDDYGKNGGDTEIYGKLDVGGDITATGNITGSNLSGTNTGDQTDISDFTGTMAEFNTACTDGSFAYSGGAFHDGFSDFVANEHIDWTASSSNLDTSGTIGGSYFISDVAVGTAPYQCTSTTLNTNLNADMVDGYHASSLISPTGAVIQFAGSAAPSGWLICDGSAIDRTTYAALFTAISTTYGAGDGSTTFNIPDLRTRVAVGKNASGTFENLGATGGVETHTLTTNEMPSHTHTQNSHTHTQNLHSHVQQAYFQGYGVRDMAAESGDEGGAKTFTLAGQGSAVLSTKTTRATNQSTTATNENTGESEAHTNLQPYIVLNYIIKT